MALIWNAHSILAERTKEYPEGSRYCWNTEATWAVAAYLKKYAATEKADV